VANDPDSESFFLSTEHVAALAGTAMLCMALPTLARTRPGAWTGRLSRGLAVALLAAFIAYHVVVLLQGSYEADFDLPLHLTDAATVVAALALWSHRPLLFELTYFWGLTASLLALLAPGLDTDEGFTSFLYWHYFFTHAGVVVAALLLAVGLGMTARPGAVRRAFLATAVWAAVAAAGNAVTGGNYMFLTERPETASPLDYMGPWPWYIVCAALLAVALFALLDLPFRHRRSTARLQ